MKRYLLLWPDLKPGVGQAAAVAHQPAGLGELAPVIQRGKHMARRQRNELNTTADEQCVGTDQKCIGPLFHECPKGRIDVALRAGGDDFDLPSDGRTRRLHFCDEGLSDKRVVGVDECSKACGFRQQLM